jgi:hypothetical protein
MATQVTDVRSSPQDQIAHAARIVGRSKHRQWVFAAIYHGKSKVKTLKELIDATGLNNIRILQEGGKLAGNNLVGTTKVDGYTAYVKDPFYSQHRDEILRLAGNRAALEAFPTRSNPKSGSVNIILKVPLKSFQTKQISVDDIESFAKVKRSRDQFNPAPISESTFKRGIMSIIGEEGRFQDWGGETNDLLTTRLRLGGTRLAAAIAFKGKGTTGKLTPKKMGKNADQIQRLFTSPASVFLVQYWNQIDQSVLEQLEQFAVAKSALTGKKVYYGVIDGKDTSRLINSYPQHFRAS